MTVVEYSGTVRAPPQRVFDALADVASSPQWLKGVSEAAVVTPGPAGVGTRFTQTRVTMGRPSKVDGTFVAYEPARKLVLDIKRDGKPAGVVTWSLAPEGAGTRVTAHIDFQLPGLMKLMTPMVKNVIRKQNEEDVASLARKVEGGA